MKKLLLAVFILYFFVLIHASFCVHFGFLGCLFNLPIIITAVWNFFEKEKGFFSPALIASLIAGFFLDVYSSGIIGFYILILGTAAVFIKIFLKNYVRVPFARDV